MRKATTASAGHCDAEHEIRPEVLNLASRRRNDDTGLIGRPSRLRSSRSGSRTLRDCAHREAVRELDRIEPSVGLEPTTPSLLLSPRRVNSAVSRLPGRVIRLQFGEFGIRVPERWIAAVALLLDAHWTRCGASDDQRASRRRQRCASPAIAQASPSGSTLLDLVRSASEVRGKIFELCPDS